MTNHHTKLEDPWAMSSLVIDRTTFDRPTDRHVQSNIPQLLRNTKWLYGGYIVLFLKLFFILMFLKISMFYKILVIKVSLLSLKTNNKK